MEKDNCYPSGSRFKEKERVYIVTKRKLHTYSRGDSLYVDYDSTQETSSSDDDDCESSLSDMEPEGCVGYSISTNKNARGRFFYFQIPGVPTMYLPEITSDVKLNCICKNTYEGNRGVVYCISCTYWFHLECINAREIDTICASSYVCETCFYAQSPKGKVHCICRTKQDKARFYIQCDSCTEWYHGGCIGILKSEADLMDTYKCISCDSFSFVNYTNQKPLQLSDYEGLKQLLEELKSKKIKLLQTRRVNSKSTYYTDSLSVMALPFYSGEGCRVLCHSKLRDTNATPFLEPVDEKLVPDYRQHIKKPMDLGTVEGRLYQGLYKTLGFFLCDISLISENFRRYYAPDNPCAEMGEKLEQLCVKLLQPFRKSLIPESYFPDQLY